MFVYKLKEKCALFIKIGKNSYRKISKTVVYKYVRRREEMRDLRHIL